MNVRGVGEKSLLKLKPHVTVVTVKGEVHKAVEEDPELRAALDKVFHTMEIQLRRGKEKRIAGRREVAREDGFVSEPPESELPTEVPARA